MDDFSRELLFDVTLAISPQLPLPKLFESEYTGRPFARCIDCDANLLGEPEDSGVPKKTGSRQDTGPEDLPPEQIYYQVQKTIVGNEAVFEFAMCRDCGKKLQVEFSNQTQNAISRFIAENVDFSQLKARASDSEKHSVDDWISACLICNRPRNECHRYSLAGLCVETRLLVGPGPFIVCDNCEYRYGELISDETLRRWDRFVEDHFDSPPWVEADMPDSMPVFL